MEEIYLVKNLPLFNLLHVGISGKVITTLSYSKQSKEDIKKYNSELQLVVINIKTFSKEWEN